MLDLVVFNYLANMQKTPINHTKIEQSGVLSLFIHIILVQTIWPGVRHKTAEI